MTFHWKQSTEEENCFKKDFLCTAKEFAFAYFSVCGGREKSKKYVQKIKEFPFDSLSMTSLLYTM